ncbi:hypothetical protein [Salinithrix halophila]|uniref:Small subunit ribosomal protein S20 n=1 Tax=Salinithrix halophila TaxID=1485204 RepID=A0ABV8JDX8_9BACL
MPKKKKGRTNNKERQAQRPIRRKRIKESDLFYSQVVAPLRKELKRAQLSGNHSVIDQVWGKLKETLKHHRILIARATYIDRP